MLVRRWFLAAGMLLLAVIMVTGGAVAAPQAGARATYESRVTGLNAKLERMVKEGKLTPGEAEVITELHHLHRKTMKQFRTEAKGVIDGAVKMGKITEEQGTKLRNHRFMMGRGKRRAPGAEKGAVNQG